MDVENEDLLGETNTEIVDHDLEGVDVDGLLGDDDQNMQPDDSTQDYNEETGDGNYDESYSGEGLEEDYSEEITDNNSEAIESMEQEGDSGDAGDEQDGTSTDGNTVDFNVCPNIVQIWISPTLSYH